MRIGNRKGDKYPKDSNFEGAYGFCGGSIIASKYILTAAHCLDKKSKSGEYRGRYEAYEIAVKIGDHNIKDDSDDLQGLPAIFINVESIHRHNKWSKTNPNVHNGYDVALLELTEDVDLSRYKPVCLAKSGANFDYKIAKAVGWGYIKEYPLKVIPNAPFAVDLQVVDKVHCQRQSPVKNLATRLCANVNHCQWEILNGKPVCGFLKGICMVRKRGVFILHILRIEIFNHVIANIK